jgi:hypothetical protein
MATCDKKVPTSADRLVYIDRVGVPHCATCEGTIPAPPGFVDQLTALRNDIDLAVDCIGIFGGVPIPVKQAICKNLNAVLDTLAAEHILRDLRAGVVDEGQVH